MSRAIEARDEKCSVSTKTKYLPCALCGKDMVPRAESISMAAWLATDAARVKAERERNRLLAAMRNIKLGNHGYPAQAEYAASVLTELGE